MRPGATACRTPTSAYFARQGCRSSVSARAFSFMRSGSPDDADRVEAKPYASGLSWAWTTCRSARLARTASKATSISPWHGRWRSRPTTTSWGRDRASAASGGPIPGCGSARTSTTGCCVLAMTPGETQRRRKLASLPSHHRVPSSGIVLPVRRTAGTVGARARAAPCRGRPRGVPREARGRIVRAATALGTLLNAGAGAGLLRPDVDPFDVGFSLAGIGLITSAPDQRERAGRLLDLLLDGLRHGADGRRPARDRLWSRSLAGFVTSAARPPRPHCGVRATDTGQERGGPRTTIWTTFPHPRPCTTPNKLRSAPSSWTAPSAHVSAVSEGAGP